jgi:hypothetical protein
MRWELSGKFLYQIRLRGCCLVFCARHRNLLKRLRFAAHHFRIEVERLASAFSVRIDRGRPESLEHVGAWIVD